VEITCDRGTAICAAQWSVKLTHKSHGTFPNVIRTSCNVTWFAAGIPKLTDDDQ